ncbi:hypothetical protein TREMEDRAFT_70063 [Tremella mesenterica DSM 1558]|uniref:uncharacterized protein n=1 Tax=Tremella mesenterica (strain ATCC 24925 / CBS 8224 / DSM 1558 / NBRC 9311 / NRRL Y-6157 / RJB 2259-6 / UBC 559-6) TaxID=578456 RepID=UPI00032BDE3E|nr:uncharacterized protein TREMEDRAFT_70063 [Tremella mesenterica DSM 1558]EIW66822.1 hypothetical protein TREMEDRAFT_70063 [Tremella mesenterica DSM 1558]
MCPVPLDARHRVLRDKLNVSLCKLLVTVQVCLSKDDWQSILPYIWRHYGIDLACHAPMSFLLMKCGENTSTQIRVIILSDLCSPDVKIRRQALNKLFRLYGWRYSVLSQQVISDRRGPIFHFSNRNVEFVATEIGSSQWSQPAEHDAALQKYGNNLPLELRQRLLDLGWSEDTAMMTGKNDTDRMPITLLPSLRQQNETYAGNRSPSPSRPMLGRSTSTGSAGSMHTKRRKAVFAPIFASLVSEQATMLARDSDGIVVQQSRELIQWIQRDDAQILTRTFTNNIDDFRLALAQLNAMFTTLTPSFAHSAFNSIVGYLKSTLRSNPHFPHYAQALITLARLAPHVSELSLRDIRRNRAELVLLPASIHEEGTGGGFNLHPPWQAPVLDVQTAQLLLLRQILRVSPREVYLFKKMLSNLMIQASLPSVHFSRSWFLLIIELFQTVNRNYTDRAELRHFLTNVGAILKHHPTDLPIISQAMRVFMLCSARFRRVFASVGFNTIMRPLYEVYAVGSSTIRDCIEYAMRSFYRIHQDTLVYQTCVTLSEGEYNASAVYSLLACLSITNNPFSGVASGTKGLNDQEELSALVQMISGPEIALTEIGTTESERLAIKVAGVTLETSPFPQINIIRLLVTVIAANPATPRSANFLRLFSAIIPHISDSPSKELTREAVEALGTVIAKNRIGDETAIQAFHPGEDNANLDWMKAKLEYVMLIESFAKAGGSLEAKATKRTLDMVLDLLSKSPQSVGPAAASILRELAKTHLTSNRPITFLRDIAPMFRMFVAVVDFSGLLDSITDLIERSKYNLDRDLANTIIDNYVYPSIRLLASASEDRMIFVVPLRRSAVSLFISSIFLRGDAIGAIERHSPNANFLAAVILPLCLRLEKPDDLERESVYCGIWIRILRFIIPHPSSKPSLSPTTEDIRETSAKVILSFQILKIALLRAPEAISQIKGLWLYISDYILRNVKEAKAEFIESTSLQTSLRVVDYLAWTIFEILTISYSPLLIHLRNRIQDALVSIHDTEVHSRVSSPGEGLHSRLPSFSHSTYRARLHSRTSSAIHHLRMPSSSISHTKEQETPSPILDNIGTDTLRIPSHTRVPSQHLTPILGSHSRQVSSSRPSFTELSTRRVSRPPLEPFNRFTNQSLGTTENGVGLNLMYRFPSSTPTPVRPEGGKGGAIIHLLSQPITSESDTDEKMRKDPTKEASRMTLNHEVLMREARKAVRRVMLLFGWPVELADEEEGMRNILKQDTLLGISEQSRIFIDQEFRDVFYPSQSSNIETKIKREKEMEKSTPNGKIYQPRKSGMSVSTISDDKDMNGKVYDYDEKHSSPLLPVLSVSPATG